MRHLYSSIVEISERKLVTTNGRGVMKWVIVEGLENFSCRLDLQFMRPGKDTPPAIVAGVIPDREGIMFCDPDRRVKPGMQVKTKNDMFGNQVVEGVFEIKEIPGEALDYATVHHIEVKVIETTQKDTYWPDISNSQETP